MLAAVRDLKRKPEFAAIRHPDLGGIITPCHWIKPVKPEVETIF
jgi:hypothetical protein